MNEDNARRQRARVIWAAWEKFNLDHAGAVPATIAAGYLRMTPQGLYQAAERGWIAFFQHGRNRLYSRRDVEAYRWRTRKFRDNHPSTPYPPGESGVIV